MKPENLSLSTVGEADTLAALAEAAGWTTVITARRPWIDINLRELWRYRDLILLFVRRDFVAQYKQTILGPLWFFLQPLLTTVMFTIVFGRIARIPTEGVPPFLFYLSGTVCWGYFSACIAENSNTFLTNAHLFGKIYFPRLVVPVSLAFSNIFKFLIQLTLFLLFIGYFYGHGTPVRLNLWVLALPLLIIQMALLGIGCGILIASLTTKYRDLSLIVGFGVQLWMYATPIVYPFSQVPDRYKNFIALNPMTAVVETFRLAFLGTSPVTFHYLIISWTITLILLFCGLVLFGRIEKSFMDTI